jgi:hypothetical protein
VTSVGSSSVAAISRATTAKVGAVSLPDWTCYYFIPTACKKSAHYSCLASVRACSSMHPPALPPSRHPPLAPRHSLQGTEPPPPSPRNQFPRRGTSLHDPDLHGLSAHGSLSQKPTLSLSLLIQWDTLQYLLQSNVTMPLVIDSRGY